MCCTLTKLWAIIIIVYASHSLAQGIRRVIATNLARFIQHLPWKTIRIVCLYAQRPVIVKVTKQLEFKLKLCVLVTGELLHPQPAKPTSDLREERKWLCWCGFPGDGAWSLLNLALIAECVLCLSCICQRVQAHAGRYAYNTVIGGNQMGFFQNGRRERAFCSASFPFIFDPFYQPLLVVLHHHSCLLPKMKCVLFPFMGPIHLKSPVKGRRLKPFSSRWFYSCSDEAPLTSEGSCFLRDTQAFGWVSVTLGQPNQGNAKQTHAFHSRRCAVFMQQYQWCFVVAFWECKKEKWNPKRSAVEVCEYPDRKKAWFGCHFSLWMQTFGWVAEYWRVWG